MRLASKPAVVVIVVGILIFLSVSRLTVLNNRIPALVPLPANIERQPGTFSISASTGILADKESSATALYLAQQLRTATGYAVPIHSQAEAIGTNGNILLTIQGVNNGLGYEGYELTATSRA